MIRVLAHTKENKWLVNIPLTELGDPQITWFWVDFDRPSAEEQKRLSDYFHFHPLAIEDCLHFLQRPKLDHYENYAFFVLHAMNPDNFEPEELDMFVSPNFIVTFHMNSLEEVDTIWKSAAEQPEKAEKGPFFIAYSMMDKLVDQYFPMVYKIEDHLNDVENMAERKSTRHLMDMVFRTRSELLKLRRTVVPMRDLLYRVINSESFSFEKTKVQRIYLNDIYDHLLKLTDMIESNRDLTADIRDNYLSVNSNRMNNIMMTLTVITTIFMPLTFIAGIYGMNFDYMPELHSRYGYYIVLGVMAVLGISMFLWFRKKGWFRRQ